jgi:hypothetical protein
MEMDIIFINAINVGAHKTLISCANISSECMK